MSRADRKLATHARLVEVARALFRDRGYDGATLQGVADAAGVAVGTVVAHFPDKVHLAQAAFRAELATASGAGLRALADATEVQAGLLACARPLYAMYAEAPALFRRMVQEALFLPEEAPGSAQLRLFLAEVAAEIARLRPDLPAPLYAQGFFADYFAILVAGLSGALPASPGEPPHEPWLRALAALLHTRFGG